MPTRFAIARRLRRPCGRVNRWFHPSAACSLPNGGAENAADLDFPNLSWSGLDRGRVKTLCHDIVSAQ